MDEGGWRTRLRFVVVHPEDPAVLLAGRDGALALPEVERPGQVWTADPDEVLPALRELLGVDAALLRCLEEDEDPAVRRRRATLVAVPRQPPDPPEGLAWVGRDALAGAGPGGDAAVAARALEEQEGGWADAAGRPWAARGWLAEAEGWLAAEMAGLGRPVTGPVRQVRAWELSCVLRAPTAAGDVWFKTNTTSPLFVNEGVVMAALAELLGDAVPAPLAVDPERGWMLLADFGQELGWAAPVEVVEEVARAFARLQVRATAHVDRLLAAGCHDRRLDRLAAQARAWLPAVDADGRLPGIDDATWLTADEAAALGAAVPRLAACAELAGHGVPASIVHGDLHLANVARGPAGYLFFDWTDACVAHPFLDLPTIRRGTAFAEEDGDEEELRRRVRDAYLAEWTSFAPPGRLARAFQLARPLGALHQAISYRSILARLEPPVDLHMAQSPAWWLRRVLADLG